MEKIHMSFHMHLLIAPLLALLHSPYSPATEPGKFCAAAMKYACFHAIALHVLKKTYSSARVGQFAPSADLNVDGSWIAEWILVSDFIWGND